MGEKVKSKYDVLAWEWLRILRDKKISDKVKKKRLDFLERKMRELDEEYTQI